LINVVINAAATAYIACIIDWYPEASQNTTYLVKQLFNEKEFIENPQLKNIMTFI